MQYPGSGQADLIPDFDPGMEWSFPAQRKGEAKWSVKNGIVSKTWVVKLFACKAMERQCAELNLTT